MVIIAQRAEQVSQLIDDLDRETGKSTENQTASRFRLEASDLGVPFLHKDRTCLLADESLIDRQAGTRIASNKARNNIPAADIEQESRRR